MSARVTLAPVSSALPPHYRCAPLPPGRYAVNLVNAGGQAWTTPNELALAPARSPNGPALSQGLFVRVVGSATAYDSANPMPHGSVCPMPERR